MLMRQTLVALTLCVTSLAAWAAPGDQRLATVEKQVAAMQAEWLKLSIEHRAATQELQRSQFLLNQANAELRAVRFELADQKKAVSRYEATLPGLATEISGLRAQVTSLSSGVVTIAGQASAEGIERLQRQVDLIAGTVASLPSKANRSELDAVRTQLATLMAVQSIDVNARGSVPIVTPNACIATFTSVEGWKETLAVSRPEMTLVAVNLSEGTLTARAKDQTLVDLPLAAVKADAHC